MFSRPRCFEEGLFLGLVKAASYLPGQHLMPAVALSCLLGCLLRWEPTS